MRAMMASGALLALALLTTPARLDAFPTKLVHDRLWSQSAPWIVVNNGAGTRAVRQIRVTQSAPQCADPLSRTDTGTAPLCLGETPTRSVWVHFIDEATGRESRDPVEFTAAVQTAFVDLPAGRQLLFVHQGTSARGAVTVRVELLNQFRQAIQPQFIPALGAGRRDFDLSGDVFLDIDGAPENVDVETPLQPDGPGALDPVLGTPIPGQDGNIANDYLGVDATEVWAFDANMRILTADRAHAGVGSAGTLSSVRSLRPLGVAARFVLARPFVAGAPFAMRRDASVGGGVINEASFVSAMRPGRMRLVLNPRRDTDGDRLGDRLERELGLCDGLNRIVTIPPFHTRRRICTLEVEAQEPIVGTDRIVSAAADPRDSDGDGLSDGAEVLGADTGFARPRDANGGILSDANVPMGPTSDTQQTLPRWGFNPLHKDLLIEMDRTAARGTACMSAGTSCPADRSVLPGNFNGADPDMQTSFDHLWRWRRAMARLPASRVANPDGRDGVEMHFDVRFPTVDTQGHGRLPAFVGTHTVSGGNIASVGGNGLVIYVPNGGSGSLCSCDTTTSGPDVRHGGFALWFRALSVSGGQNTCDQHVNAGADRVSATAMHEFGHVLGGHHGGPLRCMGSPFAPPSSLSEVALKYKISYISHMSYAWGGTSGAGSYLNQLTADPYAGPIRYDDIPTFSVGRLAQYPIPRFVSVVDSMGARREPLAAPERDTWGGADTTVIREHFMGYAPLANALGNNTNIDFSGNGAVDDAPYEGSVTAEGGTYVGFGRPLQNYDYYYCSGEDVFRASPISCCAVGTWSSSREACVLADGTIATSNTPVSIEAHTMMVTGPAVPVPTSESFWTFFVDDVNPALRSCTRQQVATPGNPCFGMPFQPVGRLRAVSTDTYVTPPTDRFPYCTEAGDGCHREVPGDSNGRDVQLAASGPVRITGPSVIAAATATPAGAPETTLLAFSQRTAMSCPNASGFPVDCPWGALTVALGDAATARFGRFVQTPVPNAPAMVGGVAVVALDPSNAMQPTAFTLLVRDGNTNSNGLWWTTCSGSGCQPMRPVYVDGGTPGEQAVALGPIAAAVRRVPGQPARLGMLLTQWRSINNRSLVIKFGQLRFSGGDLLMSTVPVKQGPDFVGTIDESAKSLAFRSDGTAIIAVENVLAQPALAELVGDPFSAVSEIPIINPQSDGGSRAVWQSYNSGTAAMPTWSAYQPSPGMVWGFAVDSRSPTQVVPAEQPAIPADARDREVPRLQSLLASTNGVIRAARPYIGQQSIQLQISARLDMTSTTPFHDFDDTATMAYGVCHVLVNSTRGLRGGDLAPRPGAAATDIDSRIRCPGAGSWGANSPITVNQAIARYRLPSPSFGGGSSTAEMIRDVVDLVAGPSWYGATPRDSSVRPEPVPVVPPNSEGCSVGRSPADEWRTSPGSAAARRP